MITLLQILLHHVILKSVPIKTMGLQRRNGSTVESPRKRKCLKRRRLRVGGSEELKTKQTKKNRAAKGVGMWNEGGQFEREKKQPPNIHYFYIIT